MIRVETFITLKDALYSNEQVRIIYFLSTFRGWKAAKKTGGRSRQRSPNSSFASSVIMSCVHSGSKTRLTLTVVRPSMVSSF